jgi:hypothetical protein
VESCHAIIISYPVASSPCPPAIASGKAEMDNTPPGTLRRPGEPRKASEPHPFRRWYEFRRHRLFHAQVFAGANKGSRLFCPHAANVGLGKSGHKDIFARCGRVAKSCLPFEQPSLREHSGHFREIVRIVVLDHVVNFPRESVRIIERRLNLDRRALEMRRRFLDVPAKCPRDVHDHPDRQSRALDVRLPSKRGISKVNKGKLVPPETLLQEDCAGFTRRAAKPMRFALQPFGLILRNSQSYNR